MATRLASTPLPLEARLNPETTLIQGGREIPAAFLFGLQFFRTNGNCPPASIYFHERKRVIDMVSKDIIKKPFICIYIILVLLILCMTSFRLRLSHLIPLLFPLAFIEGRPRIFLAQWTPCYLLILLYDSFRAVADELGTRVEYLRLIQWEKALFFGTIPTVWFQQHFESVLKGMFGHILAVFYFGHFILPVICLYWTWRKHERAFLCCMGCLCVLSLSGFMTFLLFPAAPPWLASEQGLLPPIQKLIVFHMESISGQLPKIYFDMNSNPVAAFPSLHGGYPLLWLLCAWKYFPRKARPFFLINALVVALAIISFGEHYVVDVLAGWLYAGGSFYVTEKVLLPFLLKRGILDFAMKPKSILGLPEPATGLSNLK
jgi:hypothetical protein